MSGNWQMVGGYDVHKSEYLVSFVLTNGDEQFECAIAMTELNDAFGTKDTEEMAIENFENHTKRVIEAAVRKIVKEDRDEKWGYFIRGGDL